MREIEWTFQLTRLMRGVTIDAEKFVAYYEFQLTRLMRGVTSRVLVISRNLI